MGPPTIRLTAPGWADRRALTFSVLSGLLLHVLLPYRTAAGSDSARAPVGATA